jgi:hypothetical protein
MSLAVLWQIRATLFSVFSHNITVILVAEDRSQHLIDQTMNPSMSRPSKKYNNKEWMSMYEKLQAYKRENNTCNVPKRYQSDPKLGHWVRNIDTMLNLSIHKLNLLRFFQLTGALPAYHV